MYFSMQGDKKHDTYGGWIPVLCKQIITKKVYRERYHYQVYDREVESIHSIEREKENRVGVARDREWEKWNE